MATEAVMPGFVKAEPGVELPQSQVQAEATASAEPDADDLDNEEADRLEALKWERQPAADGWGESEELSATEASDPAPAPAPASARPTNVPVKIISIGEAREKAADLLTTAGPLPMPRLGSKYDSIDHFRINALAAAISHDFGVSVYAHEYNKHRKVDSLTMRCNRHDDDQNLCKFGFKAEQVSASDHSVVVVLEDNIHTHTANGKRKRSEVESPASTSTSSKRHAPSSGVTILPPAKRLNVSTSAATPTGNTASAETKKLMEMAPLQSVWENWEDLLQRLRKATGDYSDELNSIWARPPFRYIGCKRLGTRTTGTCSFVFKIKAEYSGSSNLILYDACYQHSPTCPARLGFHKSDHKVRLVSSTSVQSSSKAESSRQGLPSPPLSTQSGSRAPSQAKKISTPAPATLPSSQQALQRASLPPASYHRPFIRVPSDKDPWDLQLYHLLSAISPKSRLKEYAPAFIEAGIASSDDLLMILAVGAEGLDEIVGKVKELRVPPVEVHHFMVGFKKLRESHDAVP